MTLHLMKKCQQSRIVEESVLWMFNLIVVFVISLSLCNNSNCNNKKWQFDQGYIVLKLRHPVLNLAQHRRLAGSKLWIKYFIKE